jgi:hypothetical protein
LLRRAHEIPLAEVVATIERDLHPESLLDDAALVALRVNGEASVAPGEPVDQPDRIAERGRTDA